MTDPTSVQLPLFQDLPYDVPSEATPTMDVGCEPDTGPDTDDGMYITQAAFRVLASRVSSDNSRPHCSSCTCRVTTTE